jgi:hypothetical protein
MHRRTAILESTDLQADQAKLGTCMIATSKAQRDHHNRNQTDRFEQHGNPYRSTKKT